MKKSCGILVFMFVCLFASVAFAAQPFDATPYKMQGNYVLHQTVTGEIKDGQGTYTIKLIGEQPSGANYNKKLFLEITPPKGKGETVLIPLQDSINGFEPRIELKSFTDYGKNDIFLAISGSDRTFKNKFYVLELGDYQYESRFLFDSHAVIMPIVKGNFRAGYRLRTLVLDTSQESFIDLSSRRAYYNQRGIYNAKNGALRKQVTTWGGEFITLEPIDVDGDKVYELRGLMVMYGTGPGDPVAQIQSVLKYKGGGWYVLRSNTAPARDLKFVQAAKKKTKAKKKTTSGRIVKIKRATPSVKKQTTTTNSTINTAPAPGAAAPAPAPAPQ